MHTLDQLKNGSLKGLTALKLSENLSVFPREIFDLVDTLEVLDLSGNCLTALPADFGRLKKLRIFFCSTNLFTVLPEVLADCPLLDIVGFKANQIEKIPAASLNPNLRWLILTDNRIAELPSEIGNCQKIQKLMLAGNRLTALPEALASCSNLSLLRISANKLSELPDWLLSMPRLSWLAFSGNTFSTHPAINPLPVVAWDDLTLSRVLGEGASGVIYQASSRTEKSTGDVAVKVFKGEVTSDGLPEDEMNAYITAGHHPGLVALLGRIAGHPEGKGGLVMELIPEKFFNLGMPPSLESCTRDVFKPGQTLSLRQSLKIAETIASLAAQLHRKGIMHGDLYAHNILVDQDGNALFGDFGAASFYDLNDGKRSFALERLEVRAFGYLLDDLLSICTESAGQTTSIKLRELCERCLAPDIHLRPGFQYLEAELRRL
ncbi:MAG: leucine-rich repeat-containing protein kinase family protein [Bacteroidota bacterium]